MTAEQQGQYATRGPALAASRGAPTAAMEAQASWAYASAVRRLGNGLSGEQAVPFEDTPDTVVDWLVEHRLLDPGRNEIRSPERALRELAGEQERQLRSAIEVLMRHTQAIDEVISLLPSTGLSSRETVHMEFCETSAQVRKLIVGFHALGREEILEMRNTFPPQEDLLRRQETDLRALSLGIRWKTLVTPGATRRPGAARHLSALQRAGAQVAVVASLPLRIGVYDRRITVMALGDASGAEDGYVIVHSPTIAVSFARIFAHQWAAARPYPGAPGAQHVADTLSPQERDILALLANGAKDKTIANRLGCSERTLRRLMTRLMDKLGAESRFTAGVQAARLGLID
jgi:DNA-binding CsgD family transcriptional regulator